MLNFTCGKVEDEEPDEILRVGFWLRFLPKQDFIRKCTYELREDKSDVVMFSPVNSLCHSLCIPGVWDTKKRGH